MLQLVGITARALRFWRDRKTDYFRADANISPLRIRDKVFDVSLARAARTFAAIDKQNNIGRPIFQFFLYRDGYALLSRIEKRNRSTIRNLEFRPLRAVRPRV